jgi:hypothetical protein
MKQSNTHNWQMGPQKKMLDAISEQMTKISKMVFSDLWLIS